MYQNKIMEAMLSLSSQSQSQPQSITFFLFFVCVLCSNSSFLIAAVCFSVSCDLGVGVVGQSTEYNQKDRKVIWKIKKFIGGTEQSLRAKVR